MSTTKTAHRAVSNDGTAIGWEQAGSGIPLVLVHGTTADHTRWAPVLDGLAQHFTVAAVDRRGRGLSGDTEPYAIQREFEDLAAVVDSFEDPPHLLGHSYGGAVALGAAQLTTNVRSLTLYEGGGPTPPDVFPRQVVDRITQMVAEGRREEALVKFMMDVVEVSDSDLQVLRSIPAWQARIAAVHTISREMKAIMEGEYIFDPSALGRLGLPTLLLQGGDSPAYAITETEALHTAIPHSKLVIMSGQQHAAMDTGPQIFLTEVLAFLLAQS